ncbi:GGDEF domain-containing protein [Mycoplasmatota bacterium]|nr:GGDEF domain-containing protein [Mycoplasmatota bacterium]
MPLDETIISITYQSLLLFVLIMALSFLYKGKTYTQYYKKSLIILLPVNLVIFLMYFLGISQLLSVFIIIFTLNIIYLGLKNALFLYLFLVLENLLFVSNYTLLIAYLFMILITHFNLNLIKNYRKKITVGYFLSFVFLNAELFLSHLTYDYYVLYNISCFIIWTLIIHLVLFLNKRNRNIVLHKVNLFNDKKTNISNYCCLLNQSLQFLKNKDTNISLILINIDRLKAINKLYGDYCGDQVIKIVANSIKKNVEEYGNVYRLDGDTFCVVSINEKFKMMQTISERIRLEVAIKDLIIDNNKINLSVSIGGYYGKIESKNIDDYIEVAYDSLLNSKYNGRNRVFLNNHMDYYPKVM